MQHQTQLEQQKITIRDAVNRVFEGFQIDKKIGSDNYKIIDAEKICLQFEFTYHESIKKYYPDLPHDPKYKGLTVLDILSLSKCGENNGNRLLTLVDELVQSIKFIEYIMLTDASNIRKCDVRLGLNKLKILTSETGESWYNRWGYKSPTHHARNMRINSDIRNARMSEFPLLQSAIRGAFPELNTDGTVHECVKHMSEQIRSFPEEARECSKEQIDKITALNMLIGELRVEYSKGLVKPVSHGSHGGYKRSATKRSATKRSAKKRSATKRSATKRSATKRSAKKPSAMECD
jgi:hypothetical protein